MPRLESRGEREDRIVALIVRLTNAAAQLAQCDEVQGGATAKWEREQLRAARMLMREVFGNNPAARLKVAAALGYDTGGM
jgi:hypothetical protein